MVNLPDPERWRRLDALFAEALERAPSERRDYLRRATGGDPDLYEEVWALVERAPEAERVLGESAAEHAGPLLSSLEAKLPLDAELPLETELPLEGAATRRAERIGPYRTEEEVGRGGMGIVYRARDVRLGRWVALKFLPPSLSGDGEAKRRLLAEARAASATEHPNVGTLHGIGETEDGRTYLVLAYYEGETLKDRIARGPLSPEEACEVARQIASGLAAAHGKGVIHRDIKPGNVFLTDEGWVKILDFGVAKLAGGEPGEAGSRLGTIAYMSPEQIRGAPADARSDLWSLGIVLFEMSTGERPFPGMSGDALIQAILGEEPDVRVDRVPRRLQPILARVLAKDPADRYASAEELLRDLERPRPERPEPGTVPSPAGPFERGASASRRLVGLTLAGLVVAAAVAWGVRREPPGAAEAVPLSSPATLPAAETVQGPENLDLLSQATEYLRRYRREDNEVAIALFEGVIEADPALGLAHARLGMALALKVFQYGDGDEWADSALASARRGVALDPALAEAHHSLGMSHLARERYDEALTYFERAAALDPDYWAAANLMGIVRWRVGDYDEALRWYRRALALDPAGHATALSTISGAYALLGFFDRSREAVEHALALQPDLPLAHHNAVLLALVQGKEVEAAEHGRALITISPGNARAWATAGTVFQFAGDLEGARAYFERAHEVSPTGFDLLWRSARVLLAHALWETGERARARELLEEYEAFARARIEAGNEGPFLPYNLAAVHAIQDRPDEAFRWLEEAVTRGRREDLFLSRDPLFDSLRGDERFERILAANRAEIERQRQRVEREGW